MTGGKRALSPGTRGQSAIYLSLILLAAAAIYQPWRTLPFDIWDFREFVPLLKAETGPWSQFLALFEYYATHGRANLLFYASLVAQWQLFGLDPFGWQLYRFGLMVVVLILSVILLRRLGASPWGTAAGAALLIASTPVQRGWVQLLAEPQALALLLGAGLVALGYQEADRWGWRALIITFLLLAVFLSKEVVGVLGGMVLIVALGRDAHGTWRWPRWQRRDAVLVVLVAGVVAMVAGLLVYVRSLPVADGYGISYGAGPLDPFRLGENFLRAALPHHVVGDIGLGLIYPSNLLFMITVALGVNSRFGIGAARAHQMIVAVGGMLLLPLAGAVVYWPWHKWDSFYGLPFFFGSVLLLSFAASGLEAAGGVRRVVVRLTTVAIVGYSAIVAQRSLDTAEASLRLDVELAWEMARMGAGATMVVLGAETGPRRLPVTGIEIKQYAAAMGFADLNALPRVLEADCAALPPLLAGRAGPIMLASYSYGCGRLPSASRSLQQDFTYRDWVTFVQVRGALFVDLVPVSPGERQ